MIAVIPLVPPEMPAECDVSPHVNVLPGMDAPSTIFVGMPLHVVCVGDVLTEGSGFTVTVTNPDPAQLPAVDVIVTL